MEELKLIRDEIEEKCGKLRKKVRALEDQGEDGDILARAELIGLLVAKRIICSHLEKVESVTPG